MIDKQIYVDFERSKALANEIDAEPKACWNNAFSALVETQDAFYVEGWVYDPNIRLAFEHGWIETEKAIIDPTLWEVLELKYFPANKYTENELYDLLKQNNFELPVIRISAILNPEKIERYNQAMQLAMNCFSGNGEA